MSTDRGCICQGCQNHYRIDLYVDDTLWKQISDGANLLCPWCILESVALTRDFAAFAMVDVDELVALRRDAERYRFLRDEAALGRAGMPYYPYADDELDQAIDCARGVK